MIKQKCWLYFLVAVFCLMGCAPNTVVDVEKNETKAEYSIGITFDTFVLERWTKDRDTFVAVAEKSGAKVDVQNANGDVEKQKQQIKRFIEDDMDVIVVIAVDSYSLVEEMQEARAKGIKIISYDRMLQGVEADLYITVDNEEVGKLMGEEMVKSLPNGGNVVMICGPEMDPNSIDVATGFESVVLKSNLNIVSKVYVTAWASEYGFQAVNEAFDNIEQIDGVMCGNDGLAGYAIKALSEQQMVGNVVVTGQDADLEACQRIIEGSQAMTVYKPIEELASKAAEFAVQLAKGEGLTEVTDMKKNDVGEYPYYGLVPISVTVDTIDEVIIQSGFHLKDDVYLNIF